MENATTNRNVLHYGLGKLKYKEKSIYINSVINDTFIKLFEIE